MGDFTMNSDNTFHAALENLCGGTWFSLVGDEDIYENIKHWYVGNGNLTDSSKIPTKEEVEAEVERIKKEEVYKTSYILILEPIILVAKWLLSLASGLIRAKGLPPPLLADDL